MKNLFTKIVAATESLKQKIIKLNDYWSTQYDMRVSYSAVSGYTVNTANSWCHVIGNILRIQYNHRLSTAIANSTSSKKQIGTMTIYDDDHILDWSTTPTNSSSVLGATGPLATYVCYDWTNNGAGTYTCKIQLCGNVGGQMAANTSDDAYQASFNCLVARNL